MRGLDGCDAIADRFVRLSGRLVAVGYLADLVLVVPDTASQSGAAAPWWTPFAVIMVFGPGLTMGALTFHRNPAWMRRAAMLAAVGYPIALGAWLVAWQRIPLHDDQWLADAPALAGLAAAVVWRTPVTLLMLAADAVAATVVNYGGRAPEVDVPFVPDLLYAYGYSLLFVAAVLMFIRSGRLLERIQADAFATAAARATIRARATERSRFASLTHDWVMSTLLAAALGGDRDSVRRQARRTLNHLDDLEYPFGHVLDAQDTAARVHTVITQIDSAIPITLEVEPDAERWGFPAAAVSVTAAATGEAVRNSVRHAGSRAARRIEIHADGRGLRVIVADDGVGFDTTVRRPDRLGIEFSIQGRMAQLLGGSSSITSRPGAGTTVGLTWSGPMIDRRTISDGYLNPDANPPVPVGIRTLLGMHTRAAWLIVGLVLAAYAASLAGSPIVFADPWPIVGSLVLTASAAIALLAVPGDPPPLWAALTIVVAGGPVAYGIVSAVVPVPDNAIAQEWSLGCAAAVCTFLCMRGRVVVAWLGMLAVFAVFIVAIGLPADGFAVPFLYLAPPLAATFFARTIRPVAGTILDLRAHTLHRVATEAAESATSAERDLQLHRLGRLTRPILEQLADSGPLDAVRGECALLEAELRDALRAPQLAHPPVTAAARAARHRGVEVILYDEHGLDDTDDDVRQRLRAATTSELDRTRNGSITVRIQRPGRRPVVTIVANGADDTRRIELDQHARPIGHPLDDGPTGTTISRD